MDSFKYKRTIDKIIRKKKRILPSGLHKYYVTNKQELAENEK